MALNIYFKITRVKVLFIVVRMVGCKMCNLMHVWMFPSVYVGNT